MFWQARFGMICGRGAIDGWPLDERHPSNASRLQPGGVCFCCSAMGEFPPQWGSRRPSARPEEFPESPKG